MTVQPGEPRSGMPGERPFEETHRQPLNALFRLAYLLRPRPTTVIACYALTVALAVVALELLLAQLGVAPLARLLLELGWMLYPLQLQSAIYTFSTTLPAASALLFLYLYCLESGHPLAPLAACALALAREEAVLLVPAAVLLLPARWKSILMHSGLVLLPSLLFWPGRGQAFAYAGTGNYQAFLLNFAVTQPILWLVAFLVPEATLLAAAFLGAVLLVGGEIYGVLPAGFRTRYGGYHYYAPFMAVMMAAVGVGVARERGRQTRLAWIAAAFLVVPGLANLVREGSMLRRADHAQAAALRRVAADSANEPVIADYALSGLFADRDQLYVYSQLPLGVSLSQALERGRVAVIPASDPSLDAVFSAPPWKPLTRTRDYRIFEKSVGNPRP